MSKNRDVARPWKEAVESVSREAELSADLKEASLRLAAFESFGTIKPAVIRPYHAVAGEAIALACLSDVHCGERVDPEDVPGARNIYNPEICRKRVEQFFQRALFLTQVNRHMAKIPEMCLALLGDLMTGYLHDDQRESNFLAPNEEVISLIEMISGGLEYLLSKGDFTRIRIPCTLGNHGRTTEKMRVKTSKENSWEYLLYRMLAREWAKEPRVEFYIAQGHHLYLQLFDNYLIRFHHGDGIQYNGGVGGIHIPLNKAIAQWNTIQTADLDVLGHWHQLMDTGKAIVNGSVIGYGAYSLLVKAGYEPPRQAFAVIDRNRGKTVFAHIFTDYNPLGDKK